MAVFRTDDPKLDAAGLDLSHLDAEDQARVSELLGKGVAVPRKGLRWDQVSSAYVRSFHASYGAKKAAPTERTDATPASTDRPIERAAHREMIVKLDGQHDEYAGRGSGLKSDGTEAGARAKMIAAHDLRPDPHAKGDR